MNPTPSRSRPVTPAQEFAALSGAELEVMGALIAVLDREHEALRTRDEDALPALAAQKADLLHALSDCAGKRTGLLELAGLAIRTADIRHFLGEEPGAVELWEQVLVAAKRANELNMANGFILKQRLTQVDQALSLLAGPRPCLYDTSGARAHGLSASRSLGSV